MGRKTKLRWGHININVSNLEKSIEFYQLLGFRIFLPEIPYLGISMRRSANALTNEMAEALDVRLDVEARACIMELRGGFPKIDLTEISATNQKPPLQNIDHGLVRLCLTTKNLERDVKVLSDSGVEFITHQAKGNEDLASIAVCRDPDGTLIELIQIRHLRRWLSRKLKFMRHGPPVDLA